MLSGTLDLIVTDIGGGGPCMDMPLPDGSNRSAARFRSIKARYSRHSSCANADLYGDAGATSIGDRRGLVL